MGLWGRRGRAQDPDQGNPTPQQYLGGWAPGKGYDLDWGVGRGHRNHWSRPGSDPLVSSGCQAQQLAVRLEPQGLLYAKLTLSEQQEAPTKVEPRVFGLPLPLLVEREQPPGQVPLIIQKCVGQIEHRGLRVSPRP
jgi:hypothetical protein